MNEENLKRIVVKEISHISPQLEFNSTVMDVAMTIARNAYALALEDAKKNPSEPPKST